MAKASSVCTIENSQPVRS